MDRHDGRPLVTRRKRRRYKAEGTPLHDSLEPNGLWCADYKGEFRLGDKRYCYPLTITDYGSEAGEGKAVSEFIRNAERTILERVNFVDHPTQLSAYKAVLRKLARRGARKPRAKVFTTNYDLCFEYAARHQRFVVVDGFSHAAPPVYDRSHFALDIVRRDASTEAPDYFENVFQLYKLHGSLDCRCCLTRLTRPFRSRALVECRH